VGPGGGQKGGFQQTGPSGVLEAEMARLRKDAKRKKEFEQELAVLNRS